MLRGLPTAVVHIVLITFSHQTLNSAETEGDASHRGVVDTPSKTADIQWMADKECIIAGMWVIKGLWNVNASILHMHAQLNA